MATYNVTNCTQCGLPFSRERGRSMVCQGCKDKLSALAVYRELSYFSDGTPVSIYEALAPDIEPVISHEEAVRQMVGRDMDSCGGEGLL